jgi:hypothetical protein
MNELIEIIAIYILFAHEMDNTWEDGTKIGDVL